jgi:hypothetical protein
LKCCGSDVKLPPEMRQYCFGSMVHTRLVSGRRVVRKMVRDGAHNARPVYM